MMQNLQPAPSRLSLETKLGMFTIVILVFTFGFLVYRKVDLHHQRLTQAAIAPQSPATGVRTALLESDTDLQAALADTTPVGAGGATDVLLEPDSPTYSEVSEDVPAASGMLRFDSLPAAEPPLPEMSGLVSDASASNSPNLALNEVPADAPADDPFGTSETVQVIDSPRQDPAVAAFSPTPASGSGDAVEFPVGFADATQTTPGLETPPVLSEPVLSEPVLSEPVLSEAAPAVVAMPVEPSEPQLLLPADADPAGSDVLASRLTDNAALTPVSDPFAPSTVNSAPPSEPVLALSPEPQAEPSELLAFAEPQGQNRLGPTAAPVFDGGFQPAPADDSPTLRAAPSSDTLFPEPDAASASSQLSAPTTASPFDTTSPASSTGRAASRTASTSGRVSNAIATSADGKFSLAAFNYQNVAPSPVDDGNTYEYIVVQKNDNYSTISKRVYGTVRYFSALAVFNQHRIPDPRKMRPGMKVLTPPAELLEQRYPQLFPEPPSDIVRQAGFFLTENGDPAFRVGGRETLSEISARFLGRASRWTEIFELNQSVLNDPNKLKPGIVLALPADAVEVNVAP